MARPRRRGLCRTDPQHAVHRAVVLHLLRPAGARAETQRNHRRLPRHGDQSRRLLDRDHPRRHRGGAQRPYRGRPQPRHDQMGGAAPHRAQPGVPKNLSGAVVADHHRHAGFGGGVADLGGGPDLCRELRGVAQLPQLRGLSARRAGLPPAGDADALAACARSAASSSRRGEPCCSSASGTSCRTF